MSLSETYTYACGRSRWCISISSTVIVHFLRKWCLEVGRSTMEENDLDPQVTRILSRSEHILLFGEFPDDPPSMNRMGK